MLSGLDCGDLGLRTHQGSRWEFWILNPTTELGPRVLHAEEQDKVTSHFRAHNYCSIHAVARPQPLGTEEGSPRLDPCRDRSPHLGCGGGAQLEQGCQLCLKV